MKWYQFLRKTQKIISEYRYKKPSTCIGGVDRIKRLSYEVLDKHKSKFNENFTDNKKQLDNIAIIRSKGLKNEIAGYITKFIKKEHLEQELRQSQQDQIKEETQPIEEEIEVQSEPTEESVIEIGVDEVESEPVEESLEEKEE